MFDSAGLCIKNHAKTVHQKITHAVCKKIIKIEGITPINHQVDTIACRAHHIAY